MSYRELVRRELRSCDLWRDLAAEGVATFVLVAVQCALPLTWGGEASASLLQTALGMGLVVALLIESFAHYGGAHMNPAVTVSMLLCNKVTVTRGECWRGVQGYAPVTRPYICQRTPTYCDTSDKLGARFI